MSILFNARQGLSVGPSALQAIDASNNLTAANLTASGTLFGTALSITADAGQYVANAIRLRTTTTNAATSLTIMPNGTSQSSTLRLYNKDDITGINVGAVELSIAGNAVSIQGVQSGTGTAATTLTTGLALTLTSTSGLNVTAGTISQTMSAQTSPVRLGQVSDSTALGQISLNGAYALATMQGIYGGGASTILSISVPSGHTIVNKVNNVTINEVSGAGLVVTGTTTSSGAIIAQNTISSIGGIFNANASGNQLIQTATNSLAVGCGLWAGGNPALYSSGTLQVIVGSTIAASSAPTGGTTVANFATTGLSITGTLSTTGDITIGGNLTVNGTTTTINTATLSVDDINIELGSVTTPTDTTAIGGGITLRGATNKTITWNNATAGWEFNQAVSITGVNSTVATLGAELTTNGTLTGAATDWTLGTNWAYGTDNIVLTNIAGSGTVSQNIAVVSGTKYLVLWSQTNSITQNAQITPSIGAVSGTKCAQGTSTVVNSQVITAGATGSLPLTFTVTGITGTGTVIIDAISVMSITEYAATGSIRGAAADTTPIEIRGTTSLSNTFIGRRAGWLNTTGYYNTFNGVNAGYYNTTGYFNTFIGTQAGLNNTTGYYNTFNGTQAGLNNTTGHDNTFNGVSAGYYNTTGYFNTFNGSQAGLNNTTGYFNTFNGMNAGYNNTTGYYNTFNGTQAGYNNTTGYINTFNGSQAGFNNTTGYYNAFIGSQAGYYNTTGYYNTFNGMNAGLNNTTGYYNAFIGSHAGFNNTAGSNNTFNGMNAGYDLNPAIVATANINGTVYRISSIGTTDFTLIGAASNTLGLQFTSNATAGLGTGTLGRVADNNSLFGYNTGRGIVTGNGNTILGANVTGLAAALTNNIIFANGTGAIKAQHDGTNWAFTDGVSYTSALSAAAGTVSLPSLYFSTDTTTGLYRIGANNIGIAVSAAKILDISSAGLGVTGALTATTFNGNTITSGTGTLTLFAGSTLQTAGTATSTVITGLSTGFTISGGTTSVAASFIGGAAYSISGTNGTTITLPAVTGTLLYDGGALGTPASGTLTNCTFPTLNQNTTGTAAAIAGLTTGDILYQSAPGVTAALVDVATGNAVISGGIGAAPSYGKIGLTTHVSGTLAVANGGTGVTTSTGTGSTVLSDSPTFTGTVTSPNYVTSVQTLTDGATINWVISSGGSAVLTLGAAGRTLANPTAFTAGSTYMLTVKQDATGSRTITTWGSMYKFPGGVKPVLSTAANAIDLISFYCDGTNFYGSYVRGMA